MELYCFFKETVEIVFEGTLPRMSYYAHYYSIYIKEEPKKKQSKEW